MLLNSQKDLALHPLMNVFLQLFYDFAKSELKKKITNILMIIAKCLVNRTENMLTVSPHRPFER